MISLSPALLPAAPRVSGGTVAAAPPGDFAAALAGLLVPDVDGVDPPVLPVDPTDRQIAAVPGKGLPDIAASGDVRPTESAGTIAVVLPAQPARVLTPFPIEAAQASGQPAPMPLRPSRTAVDPIETETVAESAEPIDPDATTPPFAASSRRIDTAEHRLSHDARAQTRKEVIAALPLPIPTTTGASAAGAVPTVVPTAAPSIDHDIALPEAPAAASTPARDHKVEAAASDADPVRDDRPPVTPIAAPVSGGTPAAELTDESPEPSSDASPLDGGRIADATQVQAPTAPERAVAPVILEVIGAPALPDAAPAAPRPLRFAAVQPASPIVAASSGLEAARVADVAAAPVAVMTAPVELPVSATKLPQPTGPESTVAPSRLASPSAAPAALPQAIAPAVRRTHPAAPSLPSDSGVSPTSTPPDASTRGGVDPKSTTDGAPIAAPAPLARPGSTTPVSAEAGRMTLPANPHSVVIARAPASPAVAQPAASIQALARPSRPAPTRLAPLAARPAGPDARVTDAADPAIAAAHLTTAVAPAEHALAAHRTPLDMRRDDWTQQLIDRIERVRDIADAADTRIKLAPDALGKIDVSMRKDGDTMHVTFTAEVAQTRAMLAEAQPRLAELAAQRGLRLGQSSVDAGAGGQHQHQQQAAGPSAPPPSRPVASRDEGSPETGRVA